MKDEDDVGCVSRLTTHIIYTYTDFKEKLDMWDTSGMIENPHKLLSMHAGANVFPGAISEQTEGVQVSGWDYNNSPQGLLHVSQILCF